MSALAYSTIDALARLTTMVGAAPLLAPVFHLFQNNITPGPNNILADFVEATFSGYVANAVAFGVPGIDPNGNPCAAAPLSFITDGVTPGVAYGIYIEDSAGHLVAAGRFDSAPYNFSAAGQQLVCTVLFGMQNGTLTVSIGP